MKKLNTLIFALAASLGATSALAGSQVDYAEAPVLSATPIIEVVRVPTSREVCWDEEVRYRESRRSATPSLIGAVIGGAVGRQFGGGRGKDAMTAVGAIVGASVARDASDRRHGNEYTQVETRCRVAEEYYDEERITGYHVRYEYAGQVYTTRTDNDPGDTIRLRVSVSPVGY